MEFYAYTVETLENDEDGWAIGALAVSLPGQVIHDVSDVDKEVLDRTRIRRVITCERFKNLIKTYPVIAAKSADGGGDLVFEDGNFYFGVADAS